MKISSRVHRMHLLVYTSRYTGAPENADSDIAEVVRVSKLNNSRRDVTGAIFYQNGMFLQFLEGEESVLRSLMTVIASDTRHDNIEYLFDEPVAERGLPAWSMQHFQISDDETLDTEVLQLIRDAYKQNFQTNSSIVLDIFKSFVSDHSFDAFRSGTVQ